METLITKYSLNLLHKLHAFKKEGFTFPKLGYCSDCGKSTRLSSLDFNMTYNVNTGQPILKGIIGTRCKNNHSQHWNYSSDRLFDWDVK